MSLQLGLSVVSTTRQVKTLLLVLTSQEGECIEIDNCFAPGYHYLYNLWHQSHRAEAINIQIYEEQIKGEDGQVRHVKQAQENPMVRGSEEGETYVFEVGSDKYQMKMTFSSQAMLKMTTNMETQTQSEKQEEISRRIQEDLEKSQVKLESKPRQQSVLQEASMLRRIKKRVAGSLNNQKYLLQANKTELNKIQSNEWKDVSRAVTQAENRQEHTTLPTTFSVSLPNSNAKSSSGGIHSLIHQRQLAYLHQSPHSPKMNNSISQIAHRDALTPFVQEPLPILTEVKGEEKALDSQKIIDSHTESKVDSSKGEVMQSTNTIHHHSTEHIDKPKRMKKIEQKPTVIANFLNFKSQLYSKPSLNKLPKRLTILFQGLQNASDPCIGEGQEVSWGEYWVRLKGSPSAWVHCELHTIRGTQAIEEAKVSFRLLTAIEKAPRSVKLYLKKDSIVVGYVQFEVHCPDPIQSVPDHQPTGIRSSLPQIKPRSLSHQNHEPTQRPLRPVNKNIRSKRVRTEAIDYSLPWEEQRSQMHRMSREVAKQVRLQRLKLGLRDR